MISMGRLSARLRPRLFYETWRLKMSVDTLSGVSKIELSRNTLELDLQRAELEGMEQCSRIASKVCGQGLSCPIY